MRSLMLAGAAMLALACGAAGQAAAVDLPWSFSFAEVQKATGCGPGGPCPATLTSLGRGYDIGFRNTFHDVNAAEYAGPNYGSAWASASGGAPNEAGFILPELKAYADSLAPPGGFGWNLAQAQGVTGFRNTSGAAIDIPVDAFIGSMDFSAAGPAGNGFVVVGLALTTDAIIGNDAVGSQYFQSGNITTAFPSASCASTGALAIASGGRTPAGPGGGAATVAATGCGGSSFTLADGDAFYIWTKLTVFRAGVGVTDAADTFTVNFNPIYAGTAVETQLFAALEQVVDANVGAVVPEPSTWAMLIAGFGGIGAMIRRRRSVLA